MIHINFENSDLSLNIEKGFNENNCKVTFLINEKPLNSEYWVIEDLKDYYEIDFNL